MVTGAADDDPSGIATYSQSGAQFGFGLTWTMLLTLSGQYGDLLDYVIFAVLLFYILTIGGLFRLRRTRRASGPFGWPRPIKIDPHRAVGSAGRHVAASRCELCRVSE